MIQEVTEDTPVIVAENIQEYRGHIYSAIRRDQGVPIKSLDKERYRVFLFAEGEAYIAPPGTIPREELVSALQNLVQSSQSILSLPIEGILVVPESQHRRSS